MSKCSSHTTQAAKGKGRDRENEETSAIGDQVQGNLKVTRSMGPDEMFMWVLRGVSDEVSKPLATIFEK